MGFFEYINQKLRKCRKEYSHTYRTSASAMEFFVVCLVIIASLVVVGLWYYRSTALGLGYMNINGITSYYIYPEFDGSHDEKLPVIIFVGHPLVSPKKRLRTFKDKFNEPVLLIWSGLLSDISDDTLVEDQAVWAKKRQQFSNLLNHYQKRFNLDRNRIYLTGFSFSAVYAWMLAYDRPEQYSAVVAMSAVSYPPQIQENLNVAKSVITVVVRGEKDDAFPRRLDQEKETGRIIESYNRHSKFILKEGEEHSEVDKYWLEYLKYILQFDKTAAADRRQ